ncbi:MAG: zinc ribbon domain-containing protein [Deltaproteobacteria bacterium]|nr:zinc ribbon domain-containing protein [Deltaproteobacteria bacterium]
MKCPKCGFFGPDSADTCKKCGKDLTQAKQKLGLTSLRFRSASSKPSQKIEEPSSPPLPEGRTNAGQTSQEEFSGQGAISGDFNNSPPGTDTEPSEVRPDRLLSEEVIEVGPDQEEKPRVEEVDQNFRFDDNPLGHLEETASATTAAKPDEFDFPESFRTEPHPGLALDDRETSLSGEAELGSMTPQKRQDTVQENRGADSPFQDGTLKKSESPLEEDFSFEGEEGGNQEQTALLSSEEIEKILQPGASESPEKETMDKAEGQILDDDEIAKLLKNIDEDFSSSDKVDK